MFAIVIQLGAILSVVVYFWNRLTGFVSSFLSPKAASTDGDAESPSVPTFALATPDRDGGVGVRRFCHPLFPD